MLIVLKSQFHNFETIFLKTRRVLPAVHKIQFECQFFDELPPTKSSATLLYCHIKAFESSAVFLTKYFTTTWRQPGITTANTGRQTVSSRVLHERKLFKSPLLRLAHNWSVYGGTFDRLYVFDSGRFSWNLFLNCDSAFAFLFCNENFIFFSQERLFFLKKTALSCIFFRISIDNLGPYMC